jgi:hypothetical protein
MPFRSTLRVAALAAALLSSAGSFAQEETPETLPDFPGREETFGYCIGCHSMKVVSRQGMDRVRWDDTLRWMTEKHNMPEPDAEMRKTLLDYLAQAFPPQAPAQSGGWVNPFAPKP